MSLECKEGGSPVKLKEKNSRQMEHHGRKAEGKIKGQNYAGPKRS